MKPINVTSPDGVTIAAYEAGNPNGPEILLLHGVFQCHLAWRAQLEDPALASAFRMIAIDLRGHGRSGKPLDKASYTDDARWAGDIAAVMAATGLRKPVLVGWSYAGRVIQDYLRAHGAEKVAGINFVGAVGRTDAAASGPSRVHLVKMPEDNLPTMIAATRGFVRGCFALQPSQDDYEEILAYNMLVPTPVRQALMQRTENPGDLLPKLKLPVLVTHGEKDAIVLPIMGRWTASAIPGARLSLYPDAGHCPFAEDAPRFNREMTEFVRGAQG